MFPGQSSPGAWQGSYTRFLNNVVVENATLPEVDPETTEANPVTEAYEVQLEERMLSLAEVMTNTFFGNVYELHNAAENNDLQQYAFRVEPFGSNNASLRTDEPSEWQDSLDIGENDEEYLPFDPIGFRELYLPLT